jgi:hypothetical protein
VSDAVIDKATASADKQALPWNTPPTNLGSTRCEWCGRNINAPALPCSVAPVDGLSGLGTKPVWVSAANGNYGRAGFRRQITQEGGAASPRCNGNK